MRLLSVLASLLLVQLPADVPGKAAVDIPRSWAANTHVEVTEVTEEDSDIEIRDENEPT